MRFLHLALGPLIYGQREVVFYVHYQIPLQVGRVPNLSTNLRLNDFLGLCDRNAPTKQECS